MLPSPFTLYFRKIYCINIAARADRWSHITRVAAEETFHVQRFEAITGDNKPLAFNLSQQGVLQEAAKTHGPVLILEDDCQFKNTMHLHYAMNELPPDWELLYLGGNLLGADVIPFKPPVRHSSHLFRLIDCWQTHAVAYSELGRERVLNEFRPDNGYIYDEWLRHNILSRGKSFVIAPQIAYQVASHSDIWNTVADYEHLFNRGNDLLK